MIALTDATAKQNKPQRSLRPKKSCRQTTKAAAAAIVPPAMLSSSSSSSLSSSASQSLSSPAAPKKPMRPLTAYHIFFQIEREHIIQTTAGEDADPSMHNGKYFLPDVPRRYRTTRLLPDWYAGPGKRQKRKHRKSHGKIGFLELSRVISKRWATLDSTDPETKAYVARIAQRELDEYKVEMREWKEANAAIVPPPAAAAANAAAVATTPTKKAAQGSNKRPVISPSSSPGPASGAALPPLPPPIKRASDLDVPDQILSSIVDETDFDSVAASIALPLAYDDDNAAFDAIDEEDIDYTICDVTHSGNYVPSPQRSPSPPYAEAADINFTITQDDDGSFIDPLFELDAEMEEDGKQRCVSPVSSSSLSSSAHGAPDVMIDEEFFNLMSC